MKVWMVLLLTIVLLTTMIAAENPPVTPWPTLDVPPTKMSAEAFLSLAQRNGDTVTFPAGLYEITDSLILSDSGITYIMTGVELWGTELEIVGSGLLLDTLCLVNTDVQVTGDAATLYNCCLEQLTLTSNADGLILESCYIDGHMYLKGDDLRIADCSYKFFNLTCTGDRVLLEGNHGNHMETGTWYFTDCRELGLVRNTMDPRLTRIHLTGNTSAEISDNIHYAAEQVDGEWIYRETLLTDFWESADDICRLRGSNVSMKATRLGAAVIPPAVSLPRFRAVVEG